MSRFRRTNKISAVAALVLVLSSVGGTAIAVADSDSETPGVPVADVSPDNWIPNSSKAPAPDNWIPNATPANWIP